MTNADLADTWRTLAGLAEGERATRMRTELEALAAVDAATATAAMQAVLEVEAELDDASQQDLTRSRLHIWAEMDETAARTLSEGEEAARETLPGPAAMRSTMAVQTVVRDFEAAEVERLIRVAPSVRKALPREMVEAISTVAQRGRGEAVEATEEPTVAESTGRRPLWQFWKR